MNQDQEQKLQISAECKLVIIWYYFDLELFLGNNGFLLIC